MRLKSFTVFVLSVLLGGSFYVLYHHSIFRSRRIDRSIQEQLAKHDELQILIEQLNSNEISPVIHANLEII